MGSRSTITSIRKNNNHNNGGSSGGGDDANNIHTALLNGKLSIHVVDVDIRRDLTHLTAKIESDYIIKIDIGGTTADTTAAEYHVSKRYLDVRNLASTLRLHAEKVVKLYASATEFKSKDGGCGGGGYFSKMIHYISTNTEHHTAMTRTCDILDTRSPIYIRAILAGIDDYNEIINSVKRSKGPKKYTSWNYVQSMTELRRSKINNAFSTLFQALASVDLADQLLPAPLMSVIHSIETFLLTDVIIDLEPDEKEVVSHNITTIAKQIDAAAAPTPTPPIFESVTSATTITAAPQPKSTRRRSSYHERMTAESFHDDVEIVTLLKTTEAGEGGVASITNKSIDTTKNGGGEIEQRGLVLPRNPTQFGIVFACSASFFKAIEGCSMSNIRLDSLFVFGIICGVLGYRLGCHRMMILHSRRDVITATTHQLMKTENENVMDDSLMSIIQQTSDSLSLGSREQTGDLLRRSLHFMGARINPETTIIPAKTYAKFPEGAKIGSHSSCWSVPPCTNFHVRGPNYLNDKVKVSSGEFLFPCRGCDLFLTDNAPINIGRNRSILGGKLRDLPTFIINYRLPWGVFISYYEIPEQFVPFVRRGNGYGDRSRPLPSMVNMTAGERCVCNFLLSDSDTKNKLLKLIPMVVDGPWVVKKVVGGKPAMVGTKLPVSYVYQPPVNGLADYLEADLDIVSSAAARNILAVVRSYTQVLTIDLGFCIQGQTSEELPEQMMLGLRLHGLNPLTAEYLHAFEEDMSTFIEGTVSTAASSP
jgi:hypothetical protein